MASIPEQQRLQPRKVWDLPVRVSHWATMVLFTWLFLSGHFGWLPTIHLWTGYGLLAVLLFRLLWGLVGSDSARFGPMLGSLRELRGALSDLVRRRPGYRAGHNPVGAVSVVLMIGLLVTQSVTGLFVETWGEVRGPLAERIDRDAALWLADLHSLLRWPVLALVLVHVGAGFWHLLWKRENRITAIMLHGRLQLPSDPGFRSAAGTRALLALAISLIAVACVAVFGPID